MRLESNVSLSKAFFDGTVHGLTLTPVKLVYLTSFFSDHNFTMTTPIESTKPSSATIKSLVE